MVPRRKDYASFFWDYLSLFLSASVVFLFMFYSLETYFLTVVFCHSFLFLCSLGQKLRKVLRKGWASGTFLCWQTYIKCLYHMALFLVDYIDMFSGCDEAIALHPLISILFVSKLLNAVFLYPHIFYIFPQT